MWQDKLKEIIYILENSNVNEIEVNFWGSSGLEKAPSLKLKEIFIKPALANSLAADDIASPAFKTSSTADNISCCMSGFSWAIIRPRSTKLAVARSTAATKTWARLDLPFFFCGDFDDTNVVTCITNGSNVFSTDLVLISRCLGFQCSCIVPVSATLFCWVGVSTVPLGMYPFLAG